MSAREALALWCGWALEPLIVVRLVLVVCTFLFLPGGRFPRLPVQQGPRRRHQHQPPELLQGESFVEITDGCRVVLGPHRDPHREDDGVENIKPVCDNVHRDQPSH